MIKITKDSSQTICPLPFLHSYVKANGSIVACCEAQETPLSPGGESTKDYWNNESYKRLRRLMLAGERPELCRKCWKNEDLGAESNRDHAWSLFSQGFYGRETLEVSEDFSVPTPPVFVELKCNNKCNLKCRMCHPTSSFRIQEDREIISKYQKDIVWRDKPQSSQKTVNVLFDKNGPGIQNHVRVLQFSGGEPLISKEQTSILENLMDQNPERIHLRYSTNLTQLSFEKFNYPELWRRFQKVNIKVSMDGIHDVFDYIRVGTKFTTVTDNFKRLLDMKLDNLHFSIGFTTQAYNVFQLPEFLEYFSGWVPKGAISTHLLFDPSFMNVSVLPADIRQRVLNKFRSFGMNLPHVENALTESSENPESWKILLDFTREMETRYLVKNGFEYLLEKYLEDF